MIEMLVEKMKGEENILNRVTLRAINRGKKYGVFSGQTLYEASGSCILSGSRDYE